MTKRVLLSLSCIAVALATIICPHKAGAQGLTAAEARNHVGESATVCGKVVSAHYAAQTRSQPTFLNLDEPYPRQVFTVLIWGSDRAKFGKPEATYQGKAGMRDGED